MLLPAASAPRAGPLCASRSLVKLGKPLRPPPDTPKQWCRNLQHLSKEGSKLRHFLLRYSSRLIGIYFQSCKLRAFQSGSQLWHECCVSLVGKVPRATE
jgi:hypothetical protein